MLYNIESISRAICIILNKNKEILILEYFWIIFV